ncbi:Hypothetical predicted protein [Mytilus galloprovincialis]|uniref:Short-chain collagen C4 n=1 Tax=Mytilus galloprovincialis TaxID=29158 RepID=A0A8B6E0C3_MYTGA|nr:Hypothetical predicted protein [Mytilus galloprovincialis]VDI27248.1 Hypothetical predicted protein [Mytilus galloprovincialis]
MFQSKSIVYICIILSCVTVPCYGNTKSKRLLIDDIDIHQLVNDVDTLKQTVQGQHNQIQSLLSLLSAKEAAGAIYTRWGRKDCTGNGTELVYEGFAGGGPFAQDGAAVNYVCLPHDPDFYNGDVSMSPYGHMSTMYGSEYEDNYFGPNMFQKDVPCAVCRATKASSIMMIPGKSECPWTWKREFYGRLAAGGDSGHGIVAASEYVCVDYSPIALEGGLADENGKLFVPVKAVCGTLRCPPYKNNAFLTCAVCSK